LQICVLEFGLGSFLAPMNALLQGLAFSEIFDNALDGLRCLFLGENVAPDDECEVKSYQYHHI